MTGPDDARDAPGHRADPLPARASLRVVGMQGRTQTRRVRRRPRGADGRHQRDGVLERLAPALGQVGRDRMRGVPDERDPVAYERR